MPLLIVDANPLRRGEICRLLASEYPNLRITQADSADAAQARLDQGSAQTTVLFDLALPDALARLSSLVAGSDAAVVALGADELRATVMGALRAGACGFVRAHQAAADMLPALRAVLDGRVWLPPAINERRSPDRPGYGTWIPTPRQASEAGLSELQAALLRHWIEGRPPGRMAAALGMTTAELAAEQQALQRRLDATSQLQLVLNLARMGLRLGLGHGSLASQAPR